MTSASSSSFRRYDIDALRALAVLLLVPFHTARLFDAEVWHMKDMTAPFWAADALVRALNIVQMPLLFLLAGMGAAWALQQRTAGHFLKERAARLIVPFGIGIFVLVAPQVWLERISPDAPLRMSPIDFDGGPVAFMGAYLHCCYPEANLSWHHLWFLPYLFLYSLPLALLARSAAAPGLARWVAAQPWRVFLFGALLVALEVLLRPAFPSTHNLVWDWANHAHYGVLVLLGWWIGRNPLLEEAVFRIRRTALVGALLCTGLWFAALAPTVGGFGVIELSWTARHAARIAAEWFWLIAFLGYARSSFAKPVMGLRAFTPLLLAFYLFHQTIIVILGWAWLGWTGSPLLKASVILVTATLTSLALAWACAQFPATRVMVGLPLRPGRQRRTVVRQSS